MNKIDMAITKLLVHSLQVTNNPYSVTPFSSVLNLKLQTSNLFEKVLNQMMLRNAGQSQHPYLFPHFGAYFEGAPPTVYKQNKNNVTMIFLENEVTILWLCNMTGNIWV